MRKLLERYQTVTVNVLNNEVETIQSTPLEVTVESLDGEFSGDIKVKTCPQRVTGNYKAANWKQSRKGGLILKNAIFLSRPRIG